MESTWVSIPARNSLQLNTTAAGCREPYWPPKLISVFKNYPHSLRSVGLGPSAGMRTQPICPGPFESCQNELQSEIPCRRCDARDTRRLPHTIVVPRSLRGVLLSISGYSHPVALRVGTRTVLTPARWPGGSFRLGSPPPLLPEVLQSMHCRRPFAHRAAHSAFPS